MLRRDISEEELHKRIEEIENRIFVRTQKLQKLADSNSEFTATVETIGTIRRLQIEKLQYPDFYPESDSEICRIAPQTVRKRSNHRSAGQSKAIHHR